MRWIRRKIARALRRLSWRIEPRPFVIECKFPYPRITYTFGELEPRE